MHHLRWLAWNTSPHWYLPSCGHAELIHKEARGGFSCSQSMGTSMFSLRPCAKALRSLEEQTGNSKCQWWLSLFICFLRSTFSLNQMFFLFWLHCFSSRPRLSFQPRWGSLSGPHSPKLLFLLRRSPLPSPRHTETHTHTCVSYMRPSLFWGRDAVAAR